MTKVNLLPYFEKCISHYRPPIDGLFYNMNDIRLQAIQLLLISRSTELGIRAICDNIQNIPPITFLDTIAAMDLYKDLLQRLFEQYRDLFELTLEVENMFSTPWECMIHAYNVEASGSSGASGAFERAILIDEVCDWARSLYISPDPGDLSSEVRVRHKWIRYLIRWRVKIESMQTAIGLMRNRMVYVF